MNLDDCEIFFYAIVSLFGNYEILLLEFGRDSVFC